MWKKKAMEVKPDTYLVRRSEVTSSSLQPACQPAISGKIHVVMTPSR